VGRQHIWPIECAPERNERRHARVRVLSWIGAFPSCPANQVPVHTEWPET
jgi:hypothetical protein